MADRIFTYKQVPRERIELHWSFNDGTVSLESGEGSKKIPGWQKNEDVSVLCELFYNASELSNYIRPDRTVSFYLMYHSRNDRGGTGIRGLIKKIPFDKTIDEFAIGGTIPGKNLAGVVDISLCLSLDGKLDWNGTESEISPLLAKGIGEILYEETQTIILEGEESYFPVADIDFEKSGFPAKALYFLQRSHTELDVDFFTAYRLYFNNKHPLYNKINDKRLSESKDFLLNMIMYDVYRQLVLNALNDESFTMPEDEEEDNHSVRFVYANLVQQLQKYYDGESLDSLRKKAQSDDSGTYNRFICSLQDFLLTFGE